MSIPQESRRTIQSFLGGLRKRKSLKKKRKSKRRKYLKKKQRKTTKKRGGSGKERKKKLSDMDTIGEDTYVAANSLLELRKKNSPPITVKTTTTEPNISPLKTDGFDENGMLIIDSPATVSDSKKKNTPKKGGKKRTKKSYK